MLEYHKDHHCYTEADDGLGLVLLWFGFFEVRRGFGFDVFFFSISSRLIERSSALHTLQYFDGLPSLSLLVKAVFRFFFHQVSYVTIAGVTSIRLLCDW